MKIANKFFYKLFMYLQKLTNNKNQFDSIQMEILSDIITQGMSLK